jgi:hypothetical protein
MWPAKAIIMVMGNLGQTQKSPFLANLISTPVLSDPKFKVHFLASTTQFRKTSECRLSLKLHLKQFVGCRFLK